MDQVELYKVQATSIDLYKNDIKTGECPTSYSSYYAKIHNCDKVEADKIKVAGSSGSFSYVQLFDIKVKGYSKVTISKGNTQNHAVHSLSILKSRGTLN